MIRASRQHLFAALTSFLLLGLAPLPSAAVERLALSDLALPDGAVDLQGDGERDPRVEARLLVDLESAPERVAVLISIEPGWHIYWHNPGEVGLATELEWHAEAASIGPIEWPAPERFEDRSTGLTSYGHEEELLLSSELTGRSQGARIEAAVELLVCRDECIPMEFSLERSLASAAAGGSAARESELIAQHRSQIPRSAQQLGLDFDARYSRTTIRPGDTFEAAIGIRHDSSSKTAAPRIERAELFSNAAAQELIEFEALGLTPGSKPDSALLAFRGEFDAEAEAPLSRFAGVLVLHTSDGRREAVSFDLPFPGAPAGAASEEQAAGWIDGARAPAPGAPAHATGWLRFLLLAFLGGILINGMPCVLPVLGIKVCSAAELAQHAPRELRRHGFAYAAGVLLSMGALASVVVALRAAGTQVGWGFQFQEPLFVAVVASVVVLFAMNLFGLFEIQISTSAIDQVGAQSQGVARSFFDGLLCVVLATPCTAPFLGTAVGFAFASDASTIIAVFLAIGAGLASPYVAVCLIPGWSRFVPRPGNWMLRLRAGLGFLLMATAVWLIWIYGRSAGLDGVVALLALLLVLSFGSWMLGMIQGLGRPRATLASASLLVAISVAGLSVVGSSGAPPAHAADAADGWAKYDAAGIRGALDRGEPVFVSFTADWCITCKVNERVVLADERVRGLLDELGFTTFRGDWTHRDEAIRAELARHGRAGVPLYLVYDPADPAHPNVLPELLTVDGVLASLRSAAVDPRTPSLDLAQGRSQPAR